MFSVVTHLHWTTQKNLQHNKLSNTMYSSKISVILLFSILTFSTNIDGFLLEPDHTSNPGVNNQCISMDTCMYLAEKKELRNQMFQLQIENEKSLQILTNQIQHKLSAMDDKLQENTKPNVTIEHAKLEQKYRELELNFTLLQQNNRLLQDSYVNQKEELALLKNTTSEVLKELSELKQMKSVAQALDVNAVQSKIHSLEQKTNSLTINQNARGQDFLALYNMTRVIDNNVNQMGKQLTTQILRQNATIVTHFNDFINRFHDIETKQNASSAEFVSKISSLDGKVANNSKKVAITACGGLSKTFPDAVVRFPTIKSEIGINNIATFISSGKFVCEIPGVYYISAHIRTNSASHIIYIEKNSDFIAYSEADAVSSYSSNPISAVVDLQEKDTLYVYSNAHIYSSFSCISIVKVK